MNHAQVLIRLVDDDDSVRIAISRLLEIAGYAVSSYKTAGEFLMDGDFESPGCLVLDVRMPGPSGLELQEALKKKYCRLPIIFLTGHGDIPMSVRAIKGGAVDFLAKPVSRETLLKAIQAALIQDEEQQALAKKIAHLRDMFETLTEREKTVLGGVVSGALNKEIAKDLTLSERTVKSHRALIMEKFSVSCLADLVRIADELDRFGIMLK